MTVLVTGDSHVGALKQGFDLLAKEGQSSGDIDLSIMPLARGGLMATPFFRDMGDHLEIVEPLMRRRIERFPVSTNPAIYGICGPLHTNRVLRHTSWQKFAPYQIAADNEIPLSNQTVRSIVLNDQRHILCFIDGLLRLGEKIFAIEAPRPFRLHSVLHRPRPAVVIYLDREYRRIMRAELSARSVPVVGLPSDVFDGDGFMHAELQKKGRMDNHHGNAAFGALMMGEIYKFLRSAEREILNRKSLDCGSISRTTALKAADRATGR